MLRKLVFIVLLSLSVCSLSAQESQSESSLTEQLDSVIIELENLSTSLQNKQIQLEDVEKQLAISQENLEKISQDYRELSNDYARLETELKIWKGVSITLAIACPIAIVTVLIIK